MGTYEPDQRNCQFAQGISKLSISKALIQIMALFCENVLRCEQLPRFLFVLTDYHIWLVVLEHECYFPIYSGISSSQLTFICFRGVGIPPTRYGISWDCCGDTALILGNSGHGVASNELFVWWIEYSTVP